MLFGRPVVGSNDEQQRKIKGELLIESTTAMGMDALGVGEGDLVFGVQWLRAMAAKHKAPYVSANLRDPETNALVFPKTRIVRKGERSIGLTSVMLDTLSVQEGRFDDPIAALKEAVAELRARNVDLVVALVHADFESAQSIAQKVPGVDLMFTGHSRRHQEDAVIVGDTALLEAGSRSKYVGEVRIDFRPGGEGWADPDGRARVLRQKEQLESQLARYEKQIANEPAESAKARLSRVADFTRKKLSELVVPPEDDGTGHTLRGRKVDMNRQIPDQPTIKAMVDGYLALLGPGADPHARDHVDVTRVETRESYGDWMGARSCMGCHPAEHKDWMGTPHSRAYAALVKDRRHFDNDCWSCHVTGANQPGGPTGPGDVGPLKNVQCESCHGPAKAHVAAPSKANIQRAPSQQLCESCHTEEQTEGRFVYSEYLPKVDHKE